jgi:hypothetical protein
MTAELVSAALRGVPLRRVIYEQLEWDELLPRGQGFDQVSIAVALDFGGSDLFRLRWRVREPFECLTTSEWTSGDPTPHTRIVDVSQRWAHLLGARVVAQHMSVQETEWGPQPWSVRLSFDNRRELVVCLGELTPEGAPTYLPDSLLVTDSQEYAAAYRPRAALTSAWTDA